MRHKITPGMLGLLLDRCGWNSAEIFEYMDGSRDVHDRENTATYRTHGYATNEIAAHLDVHYATVSRAIRRAEKRNV